ncbi:hypothetical protein [Hemidactylus frenatus papillomavirus 2]|uniref:Uncharacterized protein n=1 Tax=Hemidactylus frenatus papillomavirus 2 TaxID=2670336 RepID=A0A649Z0Z3_9PAPI|nr:hypothetical protein [Hemidactylus frenatus papillomavirus 2]
MGICMFLSKCQLPVWGAFFCNSPTGECFTPDGDIVLRIKDIMYISHWVCVSYSPRWGRGAFMTTPRWGRGACMSPPLGSVFSPTGEEPNASSPYGEEGCLAPQ